MLEVVISDVGLDGEHWFERRQFGNTPSQLRLRAACLIEEEVEEIVMESTAQHWEPVGGALGRFWKPIREKREGAGQNSGTLHLVQAQSNRARRAATE